MRKSLRLIGITVVATCLTFGQAADLSAPIKSTKPPIYTVNDPCGPC